VAKYRKKPIVIEAMQLTVDNFDQVLTWCKGERVYKNIPVEFQEIAIDTLEGRMRAELGDYVICGVQGEFYPCKPSIFEATYDKVV